MDISTGTAWKSAALCGKKILYIIGYDNFTEKLLLNNAFLSDCNNPLQQSFSYLRGPEESSAIMKAGFISQPV